jgi:hypothetical protein
MVQIHSPRPLFSKKGYLCSRPLIKKQTSYRVAGSARSMAHSPCGPAKLAAVATEAEAQGCTDFRHSERTELCDPPSQAILSHRHDIVQIYGTVRFHAIVLREENLGRHTANRGRDRCHSNSGKIRHGTVARENDNRPFLVRWSKFVKPNVTSAYSAGHTASASHLLASSRDCRRLE